MGPSFERLLSESPHTSASHPEHSGSVEQHWWQQSSMSWAWKALGFLNPRCKLNKDNRRLWTLSKSLSQRLTGRMWQGLQLWKLSRKKIHTSYAVHWHNCWMLYHTSHAGFLIGESCLHGKMLGRVCCKINEGKWWLNRNDNEKYEILSRPLLSAECNTKPSAI